MNWRNGSTRRHYSKGAGLLLIGCLAAGGCMGSPRESLSRAWDAIPIAHGNDEAETPPQTAVADSRTTPEERSWRDSRFFGRSRVAVPKVAAETESAGVFFEEDGLLSALARRQAERGSTEFVDPFLAESLAEQEDASRQAIATPDRSAADRRRSELAIRNETTPVVAERTAERSVAPHVAAGERTANSRTSQADRTGPPRVGEKTNQFVTGFDSNLDRLRAVMAHDVEETETPSQSQLDADQVRPRITTLMRRAVEQLNGGDLGGAYLAALAADELARNKEVRFRPDEQRPADLVRQLRDKIQLAVSTQLKRSADQIEDPQPGQHPPPVQASEEAAPQRAENPQPAPFPDLGATRLADIPSDQAAQQPAVDTPQDLPEWARSLNTEIARAASSPPGTQEQSPHPVHEPDVQPEEEQRDKEEQRDRPAQELDFSAWAKSYEQRRTADSTATVRTDALSTNPTRTPERVDEPVRKENSLTETLADNHRDFEAGEKPTTPKKRTVLVDRPAERLPIARFDDPLSETQKSHTVRKFDPFDFSPNERLKGQLPQPREAARSAAPPLDGLPVVRRETTRESASPKPLNPQPSVQTRREHREPAVVEYTPAPPDFAADEESVPSEPFVRPRTTPPRVLANESPRQSVEVTYPRPGLGPAAVPRNPSALVEFAGSIVPAGRPQPTYDGLAEIIPHSGLGRSDSVRSSRVTANSAAEVPRRTPAHGPGAYPLQPIPAVQSSPADRRLSADHRLPDRTSSDSFEAKIDVTSPLAEPAANMMWPSHESAPPPPDDADEPPARKLDPVVWIEDPAEADRETPAALPLPILFGGGVLIALVIGLVIRRRLRTRSSPSAA